jgi:hypothetical protein
LAVTADTRRTTSSADREVHPVTLGEILPLLIPLIALQIILAAVALWDLTRPERRVRGGNKLVWAAVIILGELLGPLIYFFAGREE